MAPGPAEVRKRGGSFAGRGAQQSEELVVPGTGLLRYLCGQNTLGHTWLYSDLAFCDEAFCRRVTSESFPPPGAFRAGRVGDFGNLASCQEVGCEPTLKEDTRL